ncbi:MAG: DUF4349 domain-containing protein, partial [Defluviitaleaceae bacterium]|nr:DUF4349 domain-containing protein [Defluviitaleaceae bacterium]
MNKKIWTAMAMLLLGVVLAGCAGSARDNAAPTVATHWMETDGGTVYMAVESRRLHAIATPPPPGAVPEQAFDMVPDDAADWERVAGQQERHVIQQAHIEMESDAFDATVDALRLVAPAVEGYVESEMRTATRWPRFTVVLRVPASRFEEVLRHIEALADIRTQNQWADDVTDQFYDMAGSLATRRIEEER